MAETNYNPLDNEPMPEGKEAPPPLTHTMAIVRWAILIALSLFAIGMIASSLGLAPWEARADNAVQYQCPMHPTYVSNQPGECPICGMSLVPIDKSGKEIKNTKQSEETPQKISDKSADGKAKMIATKYTCPMDPDVISDKPGKCPKCGMDLVAMKTTETKEVPDSAVSLTASYVCPMDPEVVSDKPGTCPKCGMDLVKQTVSVKEMPMPDSMSKSQEMSKPTSKEALVYACPMHPEVTSDKPGRCPKCGMFLKLMSTTKPATEVKGTSSTDQKDMQNMPGMENKQQSSANDMGEAPVPGLVPVTIEPERQQLIGVRTGYVESRELGGALDIVGVVTPDEGHVRNINTRVNGWVMNLFVDKTGQYVESGQPLLSIYSQDLYQAEQDFMVARDAAKRGTSDQMLSNMRNQILSGAKERLKLMGLSDAQIAELENSDVPSTQLTLTSPFSGYVLEKNIVQGQYLTPDQNLLTIADLSKVWVLGDVYEQDIPKIHSGQKASMTLAAYPGETFSGTIGYIYPSVSEQTRTLKVRIEFENPGNKIRPGMYAEINLAGSGEKVLAVPSDAILDGGTEQYAFVVHDGTHFEPRMVKTGRSSDDYVQIISGLHEGEKVVTSANFLIDSESRLKAAVSGMSTMPDMPGMEKSGQ